MTVRSTVDWVSSASSRAISGRSHALGASSCQADNNQSVIRQRRCLPTVFRQSMQGGIWKFCLHTGKLLCNGQNKTCVAAKRWVLLTLSRGRVPIAALSRSVNPPPSPHSPPAVSRMCVCGGGRGTAEYHGRLVGSASSVTAEVAPARRRE